MVKTHIPLKGSYGMEGRKKVFPRKLLVPYIFFPSVCVGTALYFTLDNPKNTGQKDSIKNEGFQQEYQEAPKFAKDSLIDLFHRENSISFENNETE